DRLRSNDENVFGRLGHRRQSAFERLSDIYSLSTTKSGPDRANSRDHSRSRGHPHRRDSSLSRDRPRSIDYFHEESYGNTCSSYKTGALHSSHTRDSDRSHSIKRGRENESPLSRVSESNTKVDPFTPRIRNFKSSRKTRMPNNVKTYDVTGDPEDHVKIFQAAAQQKDRETIEDFIERFKVETGCMRGDPECMRISGFMHGVINPELTKRLNKQAPKTMEEMMTATTAFIRGETVVASKKKGHTLWKPQDQSKRHGSEQKLDFRGQPRKGRGSNRFTPLPEHPKKSSRPKQESLNRHYPW
ncbi:hypothetical protein Tco_1367406, partial [Tanacetum coccineum]